MASEKCIKKINKKQRKSQNVVEKEIGIKCCSFPTNILVISNAGLANGLSQETIYNNFNKYGEISNIIMIPGKSSCFVAYKNANEAVMAFNELNGKLCIAQDEKPIYLNYTEAIPTCHIQNFKEKPPGLIIIENFITENEEKDLIALIKFNECDENSLMKHRQVKHFGYEFLYDINNIDLDKPLEDKIPENCLNLLAKLENYGIDFTPDQLTVNRYEPGQGIPSHVDTHSAFEGPILSLSLLSDIVMEFKHFDGRHLSVLLPKRSLAIMNDECRYDWMHGIIPRKLDIVPSSNGITVGKRTTRISFTFRKCRRGECKCKYEQMCDSYAKRNSQKEINDIEANQLENLHVHDVYNNIALHFSDTRHKPWPNVVKFLNSLPLASIILDVGCGNGKYLGENRNIFNIGCDSSYGLLNVCKERSFEIFTCNCLNVPFKDESVDGVISIAVIHHLANENRRLRAINEIIRILKVGGKCLIYVWAKDQNKTEKSSYLMQDRKNRKQDSLLNDASSKCLNISENISLPVHTNRKQFQYQDMLVPWKLKQENHIGNEFLRFYHVFDEGELEKLCLTNRNVRILDSYYDQGNWCVVFEKIDE